MPTPGMLTAAGLPSHQLIPLPITSPGSLGMNTQQANQVLPGTWAIEAQNCIIDYGGRLACRSGIAAASTASAAGAIRKIFEYRTPVGDSVSVVAYDGGISSSISDPSGSSLVGTITDTSSGLWKFDNFNGKCVGFISGQKPIVMQSATGTFSNIVESAGTAPTGGIGCAAFGRLWCMNADGETLQWCALLDETAWSGGDSGSINLSKVWPTGGDQVKAIAAFNGTLVVFGVKQIIFYGSSTASALGLDVTTIEVTDTIEGTGCISQHTVSHIGETDMLFCSKIGIQSLQRLLINKSRPTQQYSKYVRDALITMLKTETEDAIQAYYSPTNAFYALILPSNGYVWIADMRHRWVDQDGDIVARITRWNISTTCGVEFFNRANYVSAPWNTKQVGKYGSSSGDNSTNFQVVMQTPFLDFGEELSARFKALKRLGILLYIRTATSVSLSWYVDFSTVAATSTVQSTAGVSSEWGTAQWGTDQWSGTGVMQLLRANGSGTGQYFSLKVSADVASSFGIQQLNLLAKILRIA